jgi:predicted nucleotidyltransferase
MCQLQQTTGYQQIDRILSGAIHVYETVFTDRISGCYLSGSYADRTASADSDINLIVVFEGEVTADEHSHFNTIGEGLLQIGDVTLNAALYAEAVLFTGAPTQLKMALFLYGEDKRAHYPLENLDQYIQRTMATAFCHIQGLRQHKTDLKAPLAYPDAEDTFFGYIDQRVGASFPVCPLVSTVTTMASTLTGIQAQRQAGSKQQAVILYREFVDDDWIGFIEDVYRTLKLRWVCAIPKDEDDRQHLHTLCQWMLGFENYFLQACWPHLSQNLQHEALAVRQNAEKTLHTIAYSGDLF